MKPIIVVVSDNALFKADKRLIHEKNLPFTKFP